MVRFILISALVGAVGIAAVRTGLHLSAGTGVAVGVTAAGVGTALGLLYGSWSLRRASQMNRRRKQVVDLILIACGTALVTAAINQGDTGELLALALSVGVAVGAAPAFLRWERQNR